MKRALSIALALLLCLSALSTPALAAGPQNGGTQFTGEWTNQNRTFSNFRKVRDYAPGAVRGAAAGAWYEEGIRTLYERGLIGEDFLIGGRVTLGEAVSLAVRIHCIYHNWNVPEGQTDLQYALNMGIVARDQYDDYGAPATRRSFAAILANAVPAEALWGINAVLDGAIPDVPMTDPGAGGIYVLYRAGVMTGTDGRGSFRPDGLISQGAAAVAAARVVSPALRQGIDLFSAGAAGITLDRGTMTLNIGESRGLTATVAPMNAANRQVTWSSSNSLVASVDRDGLVTALAEGTAVITASTTNGITATCAVAVDVAPLTYSGTGYYTDWLAAPDFGTMARVAPAKVERYETYSAYYYRLEDLGDSDIMAYGEKAIREGFVLTDRYTDAAGNQQLVFRKAADELRGQMLCFGVEGDCFVVKPGRDAS